MKKFSQNRGRNNRGLFLIAILAVGILCAAMFSKKYEQPQEEGKVSIKEMRQAEKNGYEAIEARDGKASFQGLSLELVDVKLARNIKEAGFSQEDCHVSQVADEDGTVIPDALAGTNALLLATFRIQNEGAEMEADDDYLLLHFSFQCSELTAKGISSLPDVLLSPHGPQRADQKGYNRLYFDKEAVPEDGCLLLEEGEAKEFVCGILVNQKWLSESSDARVIAFQEMDGGIAFPISGEDLK